MKADVRYVKDGLTTEQKYDLINMMPVNFEEFAHKSNLLWRTYGVLTGENNGYSGPNAEELVSYVINRCARGALYRQLMETTSETERAIGYKLSSRYITMEETWRGSKIALNIPGATAIEVERTWYYTELLVAPDYYLEEGITLFLDGSTIIARISATLFENPSWAILRRRDDGKNLVPDTTHPRYAEYDSLNDQWLIPLAINFVNVAVGDDVDVAHRRYARMTVSKPLPIILGMPDDASFVPVYPGTNQIIPHTVISEDDDAIVYQFEVWLLVNPAFAEETVNWESVSSLHKFYRELSFAYYAETPAYLELIWTTGKCTTTYQHDPNDTTLPRLEAVLADSNKSIVHLVANNKLIEDLTPWWQACCTCGCDIMPRTVTIRIPYKVEPQALPYRLFEQIDDIEEGILHRVAAELPTADCGCPATIGFIFENQLSYQNAYMNPFTGVEVVKREFGKLHGQMIYKQKMETKQIYRRPVRAGNW